jgi:hypothetical protein
MMTWCALGITANLPWQHFGKKRCHGRTRCDADGSPFEIHFLPVFETR